jgi:hypothetical protein
MGSGPDRVGPDETTEVNRRPGGEKIVPETRGGPLDREAFVVCHSAGSVDPRSR